MYKTRQAIRCILTLCFDMSRHIFSKSLEYACVLQNQFTVSIVDYGLSKIISRCQLLIKILQIIVNFGLIRWYEFFLNEGLNI